MSISWVKDVLRRFIVARGLRPPPRIFFQMNGDWTPTLRRKFVKEFVGGDVVADIGHMFAFLRRRKDVGAYYDVLKAYLRVVAFMYGEANFDQFWRITLRRTENVWEVADAFPKYFRKTCLSEANGKIEGLFWGASGSHARCGSPPDQNLAESFVAIAKEEVRRSGGCVKEAEFLTRLEARFRVASEQEGFRLSWLGESQPHRLCRKHMPVPRPEDGTTQPPRPPPEPRQLPSDDLVWGPGRRVKVFGRIRIHPTVAVIVNAQRVHGQAMWRVEHRKDQDQPIWIMRSWSKSAKAFRVDAASVAAVARLWRPPAQPKKVAA